MNINSGCEVAPHHAASCGCPGTIRHSRGGGPFVAFNDKSNLAKKWDVILEDAEIPTLTRHDLRRMGISRALVAGMPGAVVRKLAGHKSIATTMTYYAEVTKKDLRDAVAKLKKAQAAG